MAILEVISLYPAHGCCSIYNPIFIIVQTAIVEDDLIAFSVVEGGQSKLFEAVLSYSSGYWLALNSYYSNWHEQSSL